MNIKDLEAATGIPRANIRYYEQEGLLSPQRLENGYRDYRQEDLETLLRIKLLRQLQFSLEEIRQLQRGDLDFSAAMERHSYQLGLESQDLAAAQRVCREMGQEVRTFSELQAGTYLDRLTRSVPAIQTEELPPPHPWRRFFARAFDLGLASIVLIFFRDVVFHAPPATGGAVTYLYSLLGWGLLLLTEPLWVHFLGTTPGKWVWGIRVETYSGQKLGFWDACCRTFGVFLAGYGMCIPIANLVCSIISYRKYVRGEELYWESDSVLRFRERGWVSPTLHISAEVMQIALLIFFALLAQLPPCSGNLTTAAFAKNFNTYRDYCGYDDGYYLDSAGQWTADNNEVTIIRLQQPKNPDFIYELEGGTIQAVSYTMDLPQQTELVNFSSVYAQLAYLALASARPGTNVANIRDFFQTIEDWDALNDFSCQWQDVEMTYRVDIAGFDAMGLTPTSVVLIPRNDGQTENHVAVTFRAEIVS